MKLISIILSLVLASSVIGYGVQASAQMTGGGICGNHPCAPGEVYPPSTPSSGTGITVSTDKPSYNYGDTITISGTTSVYLGDTPLTLILRNPVGNIVIATQLTVGTDDTFSETAVATGALWQSAGTYTISAIYGNTNMSATTTFQFSGSSLAPSSPSTVPNAGTNATIQQPPSSTTPQSKIPAWVKNIFIWYGRGSISDDELIGAIQFLIHQGIIKV
ncbi:MAG: hypothetical protein WAN47_10875 [Nitrosotalea sp.]